MAKLRKMLGSADHPTVIALMRLIETQSRETLGAWAADYAKVHYLPVIEKKSGDARPKQAIDAVNQYLNGALTLKEYKVFLAAARKAAQEAKDDPILQAAARAIATACSTLQTPTGALGFVFYGAAAAAYHSAGLEETADTYDELASEELMRILDSLKAAAVPEEKNPVKISWGC